MNHVPGTVDVRNLVGEEFDQIENASDADDPPASQHLKLAGKLQMRKPAEQTERGHGGVEINARHPRRAHRDGDC